MERPDPLHNRIHPEEIELCLEGTQSQNADDPKSVPHNTINKTQTDNPDSNVTTLSQAAVPHDSNADNSSSQKVEDAIRDENLAECTVKAYDPQQIMQDEALPPDASDSNGEKGKIFDADDPPMANISAAGTYHGRRHEVGVQGADPPLMTTAEQGTPGPSAKGCLLSGEAPAEAQAPTSLGGNATIATNPNEHVAIEEPVLSDLKVGKPPVEFAAMTDSGDVNNTDEPKIVESKPADADHATNAPTGKAVHSESEADRSERTEPQAQEVMAEPVVPETLPAECSNLPCSSKEMTSLAEAAVGGALEAEMPDGLAPTNLAGAPPDKIGDLEMTRSSTLENDLKPPAEIGSLSGTSAPAQNAAEPLDGASSTPQEASSIEIDTVPPGVMDSNSGTEATPQELDSERISDTQSPPVSGEQRHKRARRKSATASPNKKKSRSGNSGPSKELKLLSTDWEKCLEEFYQESAWGGSSTRWAELKSKTIERGEAWTQTPINLPTRYLAEFLQLMYSQVPQYAPTWKILPPSSTNTAAGTERRLQTHRSSHPLPFALPINVNCRNESHSHYLLPLMVVAYTALKLIQNSLVGKNTIPLILKSAYLEVMTQCPSFSTHLLLMGIETITVSKVISLVCVREWPKVEAILRKHVVDETARPARRKIMRAGAEPDLDEIPAADADALQEAINKCLAEIEEQQKTVRSVLMPQLEPADDNSQARCRSEKNYEAGDVVLRNVPCQMLLTYSAVLRLEVYKFLGIQPAMLEFDFDEILQTSEQSESADPDKALMTRAEKLNCATHWKELRKEHYRMLDQRLQIFFDFTLDRDQADWLMALSDTSQKLRAPPALSKASQIIGASVSTQNASPEKSSLESGDGNLSIDLNIDGVLKLARSDGSATTSADHEVPAGGLVNFVATRTINGSDRLSLALGAQWRLVDAMYFSED